VTEVKPAPIHVPALCDLEVTAHFRRLILRGIAAPETATALLSAYLALPLRRHAHARLLGRVHELRDNFSVYDASYVALAEALKLPFLTSDERLARTVEAHLPGIKLLS
jgi:predicted nucleic acid-binding protein